MLPITSVPEKPPRDSLLEYIPFKSPAPDRRVVLAWRKSFTRGAAIEALRQAILKCPLHGVDQAAGRAGRELVRARLSPR